MKKRSAKNFSKSLISASLRGLAVFLVFGTALYAYAVTYPDPAPGPVSGVVGLYVGATDFTSNGNVGSYELVNGYCSSKYPGTHICNPMEIINTYNHNPSALPGPIGSLWLNSGPPAFTERAPNDCNGWTVDTDDFFATSWSFTLNFGTASSCDGVQAFACCK